MLLNSTEQIEIVDNTEELKSVEYVSKGMDELRVSLPIHLDGVSATQEFLQSWEWAYGQTPKFTYTLNRIFDWGDVVRRTFLLHAFHVV